MGKNVNAKYRVLVGEDSPDSRRLIELYLKRLGVEAVVVDNGATLVARALAEEFSVLLVDVSMPELDGVHAVQKLRAAGYAKPIISISANGEPEDLARYREAGFTDFLAKPFERERFIKKLRDFIEIDEDAYFTGSEEWKALTEHFVQTLPEKLGEMRDAFAQNDFSRLGFLAHRVRGAAMFGLTRVTDLCGQIDAAVHASTAAPIPDLLDRLEREIESLQRAHKPQR